MFTRLTQIDGEDFMREALGYSERDFINKQKKQNQNQSQVSYDFQDASEIQVIDLERELPVQRQLREEPQIQNNSNHVNNGAIEVKTMRFNIEINIKVNVRN